MQEQGEREVRVRNGDRLSGAVLLVLSVYVVYEALRLSFGTVTRPGPGFLPTLLAVLLIGTSGMILLNSLRAGSELLPVGFGARTVHILATITAVLLYAAILETIGFLLCTFALVLIMLIWIGKVPWLRSFVVAATGTLTFYIIFTQLGVPLPKGILAF